MFVNFFALKYVCQLCQRIAKFTISIDNLSQKVHNKGVCLRDFGTTQSGQTYLFRKKKINVFFRTSVLVSPNLSTAFELNIALPTATNQAHATALT